MTQKPLVAYMHTLVDSVGVAGSANTYLSVFNPSGSGIVASALLLDVQAYSTGATLIGESLQAYRISAASGGTAISAAAVNRFNTLHPDPTCVVRVGNPTITTVGTSLRGVSPTISSGVGTGAPSGIQPPGGASFLFQPGEGIAFRTDDGDVDAFWNISYVWGEAS